MRWFPVLIIVLLFALSVPATASDTSGWKCEAETAELPKISLPSRPWGPKLAGFIGQLGESLDVWLTPPEGGIILIVRCS